MKASTWLRALAVLMALFTLGHTLGTAAPRVTRGAPEAAIFSAMQSLRFPIMGFDRTHWDFYRGFAITGSILMLFMAIVAWQVGDLAKRDPRSAMPLAVTLLLGSIGLLVVCWCFFFAAPIAFSALAVTLAGGAIVALRSSTERIQSH